MRALFWVLERSRALAGLRQSLAEQRQRPVEHRRGNNKVGFPNKVNGAKRFETTNLFVFQPRTQTNGLPNIVAGAAFGHV